MAVVSVEHHQISNENASTVSSMASKPEGEGLPVLLLSRVIMSIARVQGVKSDYEDPKSVDEGVNYPLNHY